jgi:hypothetical protein
MPMVVGLEMREMLQQGKPAPLSASPREPENREVPLDNGERRHAMTSFCWPGIHRNIYTTAPLTVVTHGGKVTANCWVQGVGLAAPYRPPRW